MFFKQYDVVVFFYKSTGILHTPTPPASNIKPEAGARANIVVAVGLSHCNGFGLLKVTWTFGAAK